MKVEYVVYRTTEEATGIDLSVSTDQPTDDQSTDQESGGAEETETGEEGQGADDTNSESNADGEDSGEGKEVEYEIPKEFESFDQEAIDEAIAFAKDIGLDQTQFGSVFEFLVESVNGGIQANVDDYKAQNQEGLNALRDDLGANGYDKLMTDAGRVVGAVGDPEFIELMEKTDLGNNPIMARFLGKLGGMLSEDGLTMVGGQEPSKATPNPAEGDDALAKKFYPNMK